MQKEFIEKKKLLDEAKKRAIMEKYGGDVSGKVDLDVRLRLGQTEAYVEYSRDGLIVKGLVNIKGSKKTKYEEDVYINNHTSVWGSYYNRDKRSWGKLSFTCNKTGMI